MDLQSPTVGPRNIADGAEVDAPRLDKTGALVVTPAHGEYYEEASRGNVWTISSAAAGVIVTAAVLVSTSAARPIAGLYNPAGSSVNLHITRTVIVMVSGTMMTAGFCWGCVASPTAITSTGQSGINNKSFATGGHQAVAFNGSTIATGITTTVPFRYIAGFFPGAATAGQTATIEEVEEDFVVAPGTFVGIFGAGAAGTNTTASASISWAEVPA